MRALLKALSLLSTAIYIFSRLDKNDQVTGQNVRARTRPQCRFWPLSGYKMVKF